MKKIPMECKIDKNGLFYIDNDSFKKYSLRFNDIEKINLCNFYELLSTEDYIIKCSNTINNEKTIEMLLKFQKYQGLIKKTDFPIGYYLDNGDIKGLIIPYYSNSPSLMTIKRTYDLAELSKYYYHSDDIIKNVYLLCMDIINIVEELYQKKIYYLDVHDGNFVFSNNEVKLIDFDPNYIEFSDNEKKDNFYILTYCLENMIIYFFKKLKIFNLSYQNINSFDDMRSYVKKIGSNLKSR